MKCRSIAVVALLVSLAYAGPALAQNSKAVTTMASILMTVNHFPNDDQKKTLTALAAEPTTTAQEKVLISAIVGMQHSVAAAEKPKVEAVAKDQTASAGARTIATILGRFLHMASDADKAELKKLSM
jgi:hypothetical protein